MKLKRKPTKTKFKVGQVVRLLGGYRYRWYDKIDEVVAEYTDVHYILGGESRLESQLSPLTEREKGGGK